MTAEGSRQIQLRKRDSNSLTAWSARINETKEPWYAVRYDKSFLISNKGDAVVLQ
jgi:hypothetical protein